MKPLILALATARLTQLAVDDEITEPIRVQIAGKAVHSDPVATMEHRGDDDYRPTRPWELLDEVVSCHACTSVWAGGGVLAAEHAGPVGRFLVRVLALSQAALAVKAVIERIDRD